MSITRLNLYAGRRKVERWKHFGVFPDLYLIVNHSRVIVRTVNTTEHIQRN